VGLKGEVSAWPGFSDGRWWVQDASAAVPARLLDAQPGQAALDMCAAPGGKTLQLAAAGAEVTALDRSAPRLKRVSENLARTGLSAQVVAADAANWTDKRSFDAILLDAPCSATGTFRRHPDVLWAAKPSDVAGLAAVQSKLLDAAVRRLKPGGRLVYCVCSLETEEGEGQVAAFLSRAPGMTLDPIAEGEGGSPAASLDDDGTLRILPHHAPGGMDGFYVARFRKS
jgi:16S rRNA (cytosine967-C5)-methyltransferase